MIANCIWHQYNIILGKAQKEIMFFYKCQEMYVDATFWSKKVLSIFLTLTSMKHPYHAFNSYTKHI
jgi:hypothetical protein